MQSKFSVPNVLASAVTSHTLALRHEDQELLLKFSAAVLTALPSMSTPKFVLNLRCAEQLVN